jgi:hypothetical protein
MKSTTSSYLKIGNVMRYVHCRRCWQPTAFLTRSCTHCGEKDRGRVVRGLGELAVYLACGALAIGAAVWIATNLL